MLVPSGDLSGNSPCVQQPDLWVMVSAERGDQSPSFFLFPGSLRLVLEIDDYLARLLEVLRGQAAASVAECSPE